MRNSVVFKFIALILCAAALLGVAGSGAGILVLTETGLYSKTAEQLYQENLEMFSQMQADGIARYYADKTLGGCSQLMLESYYGRAEWYYDNGPFEPERFGYSLRDAEGSELAGKPLTYDGEVTTFTFPVTGQYMHLVEEVSAAQKRLQEVQSTENMPYGSVQLDLIPARGSAVHEIEITTASGGGSFSTEGMGVAIHNEDGRLICRFPAWVVEDVVGYGQSISYVALWGGNGELLYLAENAAGVGTLQGSEDGPYAVFEAYDAPVPVPAETVPAETYVEGPTVVATEEAMTETVPETAAVEASVPEEKEETGDEAPDSEKEEKTEEKSDSEKKEKTEEKTDSEKKEKTEEKADSEKKEKTEETSDSEKKEKTEEKSDSEKKEKTEETSDSEKKEKTEETSDSEKAEKTEEKSDSEKKEKTEEKSDSEKKETSEEASESEKKEASEEESEEDAQETQPQTEPTVPETEPTMPAETEPPETIPPVTEPEMINGKRLDEYQINRYEYAGEGGVATAKYVYIPMPEMTVEFYVAPNALDDSYLYSVLSLVRSLRSYLLPVLGACLAVLAAMVVYLCCAAGRKPRCEEVRAGGLNRMPIDLYAGLACGGIVGAAALIATGGVYFLQRELLTGIALSGITAFLSSLLIVGFFFAFAAQLKTPGGFWWRNSLVGWSLKLLRYLWKQFLRLCVWMEEKLAVYVLPALVYLLKWVWSAAVLVWKWLWEKISRFFRLLGGWFNRFYDLLPIIWQWLLVGFAVVLVLFIAFEARSEGLVVFWFCISFAIVLYGAHCFGALMEAARKMNKGNLDSKVDDKLMVGAFKDFAKDLNDLGGVAVVAAQKQLKSERMKTELITNVSHDIKTPLTSIINYVDLLQKPHTEQEQEQYLEVLDRQSQRLKKLIDDLMDMSKASTGNMAVDITLVDAVESVNQALGEFADKLERAEITPVFRHFEDSVEMMADGRLVWRVLSNLLGNAVKYAMPGTRLYIDLMSLDNEVVISLKNISRDELNVDADELMERFVRGDDSRNTEGSGLGLNIAKSLMELQKGQLQLLVDGDLFKVTLIFPGL